MVLCKFAWITNIFLVVQENKILLLFLSLVCEESDIERLITVDSFGDLFVVVVVVDLACSNWGLLESLPPLTNHSEQDVPILYCWVILCESDTCYKLPWTAHVYQPVTETD